jgi:hypothetical protein
MKTINDIIAYVINDMTIDCYHLCSDISYCTDCKKIDWCFYNTIDIGLEYLYKGKY